MIGDNQALKYFANRKCNIYKHYYSLLTPREKRVYDSIDTALLNYEKKFDVESVGEKQLNDIFQKIVHDNPNLFYVEGLTFRKSLIFDRKVIVPKYRFDEAKANATLAAVINKCKLILKGCGGMPPVQIEKRIHDYFCNNIIYDMNFADSSFECVGPLLFGKGVCEGISKAAKLLFDFAGIKSVVLHGNSLQTQLINFTKNNLHAWNVVCVGANWHHVDITFDLSLSTRGQVRYDYFNLSDDEMNADHKVLSKGVPKCNKSECYYKANKLYFNTKDAYKQHVENCLAQGKKDIIFKLPPNSGKDIKHVLREVIDITSTATSKMKQVAEFFKFTYNKHQYVFHIYFEN